jgi:hypothetical protein
MKLILQITLGVFMGTLASQLTTNVWHARQENTAKTATEKLLTEQEKVRLEQGERIRSMLLKGDQSNTTGLNKLPR